MSYRTQQELQSELVAAVRSGGRGGKTTAQDLRAFLTSLIEELTHYPQGLLALPTLAERDALLLEDALDTSGLRSGQRTLGMLVYVAETAQHYVLYIPQWPTLTQEARLQALADNSNWVAITLSGGEVPTDEPVDRIYDVASWATELAQQGLRWTPNDPNKALQILGKTTFGQQGVVDGDITVAGVIRTTHNTSGGSGVEVHSEAESGYSRISLGNTHSTGKVWDLLVGGNNNSGQNGQGAVEGNLVFSVNGDWKYVLRKDGRMGVNTNYPDPSATLEVGGTGGGLLLPRLTTAQRDTIVNPAQGLILFNTTTQQLENYIGTKWIAFGSISSDPRFNSVQAKKLGLNLPSGSPADYLHIRTQENEGGITFDSYYRHATLQFRDADQQRKWLLGYQWDTNDFVIGSGTGIDTGFRQVFSSQGSVGINALGKRPDPTAILDLDAVEKGLLIPRMTASQRQAIAGPALGLQVYQTDGEEGIWIYKSTGWTIQATTAGTIDASKMLEFVFEPHTANSMIRTLGSRQATTYRTQQLQNVTSVYYKINGETAQLPFAVAAGDTLEVGILPTNADQVSLLTLEN